MAHARVWIKPPASIFLLTLGCGTSDDATGNLPGSSGGEGAFPLTTCGMNDGTAVHCRESRLQEIIRIIALEE